MSLGLAIIAAIGGTIIIVQFVLNTIADKIVERIHIRTRTRKLVK